MPMDSQLLESLLHQEEGSALDFKWKQYPFEKATNEDKSELLKDILAFANSWRQTTAYILIGVQEVKGGRGRVTGVQTHLEDAKLHQFVNSKTQRGVEFSYAPFHTEGVQIGVIEVPSQERPTFLKKSYGKLDENIVYVRDGSSTSVATPDEIARMGAHQVLGGTPQLLLEWADIDRRVVLDSPYVVCSLHLDPHLPSNAFEKDRGVRPVRNYAFGELLWEYPQDRFDYAADRALFAPLGLCLRNGSGVVAKRVRFTGSLARTGGIELRNKMVHPDHRSLNYYMEPLGLVPPSDGKTESDVRLNRLDDAWEIMVDFGDIRPHDEVWMTSAIFIGSTTSGPASLDGKLLADNLPDPIKCKLEIRFEVERRPMKRADVEPFLDR